MIEVRVAIICEECGHWISLEGGAGTNATRLREIAGREYGWTTTKGDEACFDHRGRPIRFHPFTPARDGSILADQRCRDCDQIDYAAAQGRRPHLAQHDEAAVRKAAAELQAKRFAVWR